ncbi:F1 complex, delta/epsilon subunit of ATPase [Dimargaris cristalligena]|uniref:ATP synthase subunit delta, mitochondrial n=1 Tax=Dimargaris cristalligena TaxID=215637 RepID=A0A4P9ZR71_9FUNG|nr:F1 complex, delta/epsilon subunit of ATPase [Dimargaris cristalligena]|eukprot:RKP36004.1 F1 complex, delta/epsilon subunit of ATPase [Dimargaris cristalligena]
MNFLRSTRTLAALRPARLGAAPVAAAAGKLTLNFVLPHQVVLSKTTVQQVNLAGSSGDLGILADHVPSIEQLKPGVVEVIIDGSQPAKKWFVSGGFAIMNPDSSLNINAVEAFALDEIDVEAVRQQSQEAERVANGSGTEYEKAAAKAQLEVYEALQAAL